ncbi:MAG: ABC transporter ATP-binding protein/permease, partial [Nitrosomonas sp.]|nr:ABC transporter ATP-binding protein/permease [Nitrosomonas sp.]
MTSQQCYLRLFRRLKPYWQTCLLALFAMMIMALTLSVFPLFILQLLDATFVQENQLLTLSVLLTIIALFVARSIANLCNIYAVNKLCSKLGGDLREALFDKLLSLPINQYSASHQSKIADKFTTDINQATQSAARLLTILILDSATIIGLILCVQFLNWELSFLMFLIVPLLVVILLTVPGPLDQPNPKKLHATKTLSQHLLRSIKHYKTIKLNGAESQESLRFKKFIAALQQTEMQQANIKAFLLPLSQMIIILILAAMAYLIMQQAFHQAFTLVETSALVAAILLLITPMKHIVSIPRHLQHGERAIKNIFSLLDEESEPNRGKDATCHLNGELSFEHVFYQHNPSTKSILNDISFTVKPGETLAVVGTSKHERSALIDLTLGFAEPTSGKILLDNRLLTDIKLESLHRNISLVSDDAVLLDDTVAGNIAYGAMRCTNETEITAASKNSHAVDFIRELPEGLQTKIGENGVKLSKKQCQHIIIAQALVKNTPILIVNGIPTIPTATDP